MILSISGDDALTIMETVAEMKQSVGVPEVRDVNITTLGADATLGEIEANASTTPFLADKRLVIVEGLLAKFESGRRASGAQTARSRSLAPWERLPSVLAALPDTSDLVFVDGKISASNPMLKLISSVASARTHLQPRPGEIPGWIARRAKAVGVEFEPGAVTMLADAVGTDLFVLASEIDKLAVAAAGRAVTVNDVALLVPYVKTSNIFAAVDAIVEGRASQALGLVHALMAEGNPPGYVITMIARQSRLLMLAKHVTARGLSPGEASQRLKLSGYPLRKTLAQSNRFSMEQLIRIHRMLLEADLSIKSTGADGDLIISALVAEVASDAAMGGRA